MTSIITTGHAQARSSNLSRPAAKQSTDDGNLITSHSEPPALLWVGGGKVSVISLMPLPGPACQTHCRSCKRLRVAAALSTAETESIDEAGGTVSGRPQRCAVWNSCARLVTLSCQCCPLPCTRPSRSWLSSWRAAPLRFPGRVAFTGPSSTPRLPLQGQAKPSQAEQASAPP